MDFKLEKEELVTLSDDQEVLNDDLTPAVAGGGQTGNDPTRVRHDPQTSCAPPYECEML